jgi:hypothetical protein
MLEENRDFSAGVEIRIPFSSGGFNGIWSVRNEKLMSNLTKMSVSKIDVETIPLFYMAVEQSVSVNCSFHLSDSLSFDILKLL